MQTITGNGLSIRVDELGAFMADLAVNGSDQDTIENSIMAEKGKTLLQARN
jgi:hypothetical protein